MPKIIHKFTLTPGAIDQWHAMPLDAQILTVGNQYENFVFWAEVDPGASTVKRYFTLYGTGHLMPIDPGAYIGSAQFMDGQLVWHAYEVPAP